MNLLDADVLRIANEYGTPIYLYDGDFLKSHYEQIRNALHDSIDVFLSFKANNNLSIAKQFCLWGSGIEVASLGEFNLALKAGFSPENIIFSGPGKTESELTYAINHGAYCIIIESIDELMIILDISKKSRTVVNVGVRINPDQDLVQTSVKMAGVPRQFGIDESQLDLIFATLKNCKDNVQFIGIHVYAGTQLLNPEHILQSFKYTIELAIQIKNKYEMTCKMIDLGGGFGVPYFTHEEALDFSLLASEINKLIENALKSFPYTRFIIESGRFLLAESGVYIAKVLYTKYSKGEKFIITDGGLHHHAASTFRGKTMRNNFPVKVIKKTYSNNTTKESVHIVGPLCTPEDCIARKVELPEIESGDLISVAYSGAYGLTYSPNLFLGHPTPIEIMVYNKNEYVIRNQGKPEDLLLNQNSIDIR